MKDIDYLLHYRHPIREREGEIFKTILRSRIYPHLTTRKTKTQKTNKQKTLPRSHPVAVGEVKT